MKFEYQKKVASLNTHKKQGTNSEALEKAKAAVSHLHTRYIVDMNPWIQQMSWKNMSWNKISTHRRGGQMREAYVFKAPFGSS